MPQSLRSQPGPPTPVDHYSLVSDRSGFDEVALANRMRERFSSPTYSPPRLPSVAFDVLTLSRRPNVPMADLVALLERDPFLASRVVSLAQSPFYGGSMPVVALHPAVVRLGLSQVRQLVLEAALDLKLFTAQKHAATMQSVRRHSTAVAYFARMVARFTAIDAETAFLTGLVHDIGFAAGLLLLGDAKDGMSAPLTPYVWSALDRVHADVSQLLVSVWGLSAPVEISVGQHHGVISGPIHPLASVIMLAESLVAEFLGGISPTLEPAPDEVVWSKIEAGEASQRELATSLLRIDGPQLKLMLKQAESLVQKLGDHA